MGEKLPAEGHDDQLNPLQDPYRRQTDAWQTAVARFI